MHLFNCHTHTAFSHDGKGNIEKIYAEAERLGLMGFAVTDHLDCEFSEQKETAESIFKSYEAVKKFNSENKGSIIVAAGVEIGEAILEPQFAEHMLTSCAWDVVLGSVHAVRIKNYEMPFSLIDFSEFSYDFIIKYINQYFEDLLETAEKCDYDILSHLTVIFRYIVHKYKIPINEKAFYPVISDILKIVIKRNKTLEVNTSGVCDGYIMPDREILIMYKKLGGTSISIGSDSHTPENLSTGLFQAVEILKDAGFNELSYYIDRKQYKYCI